MLPLTLYATASVAYCSMAMRASFSCTWEKAARRWPNCVRVAACSAAWRSAAREVPAMAAPMPKRPLLRMFIATLKPFPTPPSTFASGTFTSS